MNLYDIEISTGFHYVAEILHCIPHWHFCVFLGHELFIYCHCLHMSHCVYCFVYQAVHYGNCFTDIFAL